MSANHYTVDEVTKEEHDPNAYAKRIVGDGTDNSPLTATPSPMLLGAAYISSVSTALTDYDRAMLRADANQYLFATLGTLLAGEDLTNNVMKVESQFTYSMVSATGTTTIKSGAGFIHTINVNGQSTPSITIYDNTAASGAVIWGTRAGLTEQTFILNAKFTTGLTLLVGAGVNPQLEVSYR